MWWRMAWFALDKVYRRVVTFCARDVTITQYPSTSTSTDTPMYKYGTLEFTNKWLVSVIFTG